MLLICPDLELRKVLPIDKFQETIDELEAKHKTLNDKIDMQKWLKSQGFGEKLVKDVGKSYLESARLGYINVVKLVESPMFPLTYTN